MLLELIRTLCPSPDLTCPPTVPGWPFPPKCHHCPSSTWRTLAQLARSVNSSLLPSFFLQSFFSHLFVCLFIYLFIHSFIYWLCWVFIAARGLCLVVVSGGFSCCGAWALGTQASVVVACGL